MDRATPHGTDAAAPRRARRGKGLPILCVAYAICAIAYWLLIRYLGDRWWPATILLFAPRWPWLLPSLLLLPLSLRRGKLIWVPLATLLFVIGPLMGFSVPWHLLLSRKQSGTNLRLLVCNVHRNELDLLALDQYIASTEPEVVLFQDYSGRDAPTLPQAQADWHEYRVGEIFLASRYPILHVYDLHLERLGGDSDPNIARRSGSAICFDLLTPAGQVHVLNLHLASPHGSLRTFRRDVSDGIRRLKANTKRRELESKAITQWLSTQSGPCIIAGDFNTPAESPIYREFWSAFPDAFSTTGFGFGYTHFSALSELRIDHLLTTPDLACTACRIGPRCGTPHRPVVVDLRM